MSEPTLIWKKNYSRIIIAWQADDEYEGGGITHRKSQELGVLLVPFDTPNETIIIDFAVLYKEDIFFLILISFLFFFTITN